MNTTSVLSIFWIEPIVQLNLRNKLGKNKGGEFTCTGKFRNSLVDKIEDKKTAERTGGPYNLTCEVAEKLAA